MQEIKLGVSMRGIGYHPSAWHDPDVPVDGAMRFDHCLNVAKIAERGLFDFVFLADQSSMHTHDSPKGVLGRAQEGSAEFEPMTLLAALSQATSNIGLIATVSATFYQPYHLARLLLSIDHLSGGRAGWNVVTSTRESEAQNFSQDQMPEKNLRYERARETVDVVFGLWESWDDDAFIRDRKSGLFFDPHKMHILNHVGKHFKVRGPLNLPRSVQGRPIIAQAGASEDGREFAASVADVIYSLQTRFEDAKVFYRDMKQRIAKAGRDPDGVKILPGFLPVVGNTNREAHDKYKRLLSFLDPLLGLERVQRFFGDLSGYDVDGPLPQGRDHQDSSRGDLNLRLAREQNWSIRQLYEQTVISHGHHVSIGTPGEIADEMQQWIDEKAADGFNIVPALLPSSLQEFVDMVVPELQRRGVYRKAYAAPTLRGNLGASAPVPRHTVSTHG